MMYSISKDRLFVLRILEKYPKARESFNKFLYYTIHNYFKGDYTRLLKYDCIHTLDRMYRVIQNDEKLYRPCDKIERLYSIKKKEKQYIVKMSKRQIDLLMCCELNGITNTNEFNKRLT